MKLIIYLKDQSICYDGDLQFDKLISFVMEHFEKVPKMSFGLSYLEPEGDLIELTSDLDMQALKDAMEKKFSEVTIFVQSIDDLKFNQGWECAVCTFVNSDKSAKQCDVCASVKDKDPKMVYIRNPKNMEKSVIKPQKVEEPCFKPSLTLFKKVQQVYEPIVAPLLKQFKKEPIVVEKNEPVVIKQEIEVPVLKLEKKASSDKKEKLSKLNAKLEKLNEKKEKLKKKCAKKQLDRKPLAFHELAPKMVEEALEEKKEEKKPEYFVFAGVEKSMNRVSQEYIDGKLTMQEFTSAWNNEATILKKKVCWMKAEAMKKQQEKAKESSLVSMTQKREELQKQLEEINKSIVEQEKVEKEKAAKLVKPVVKKMVQPENGYLRALEVKQQANKSFNDKLVEMATVFGGKPEDYQKYLLVFPEATTEEFIDMIVQCREEERGDSYQKFPQIEE